MQPDQAAGDKYRVARMFHESLTRSQWLPPETVERYQESQLRQLLAHAAEQVPYYRGILARLRLPDGRFDLSRWHEVPVISRRDVSGEWEAFQARELPPGHRDVLALSTSGSEGEALKMRKTRFEHTGTACASYRYAEWFGYDYAVPLAMIRAGFITSLSPDDPEDRLWGPPWIPAGQRGARHRMAISTSLDAQLDWLAGLGRVYLNTLPSRAMALAQRAEERGLRLDLAAILTVGERLSDDVRSEVRRIFGCRISDVYATAEAGLVAIECPETGCYHIQSEISRVEILKEDGTGCAPGETGQVVVTSLYNFAMPLLRYRFGDFVTRGDPCACGRSLPVISRMIGRDRGLFRLPGGRTMLPEFSTPEIKRLSGTAFWQVAQTSVDRCELRLKTDQSIAGPRKQALADYIRAVLGVPVEVSCCEVADFPHSSGGKFYPVVREFD